MKLNYNPKCDSKPGYRFALEQKGEKMLFVIGLNPSTADEKQADPTMRKILRFAEKNGYDGYVMFNLTAERTPNPNKLSKELNEEMHRCNLKTITKLAERYPDADVLPAFGNGIGSRIYLRACFREICNILQQHRRNWKYIALTKYGHPRHPLYLSLELPFQPFDIESYVKSLK